MAEKIKSTATPKLDGTAKAAAKSALMDEARASGSVISGCVYQEVPADEKPAGADMAQQYWQWVCDVERWTGGEAEQEPLSEDAGKVGAKVKKTWGELAQRGGAGRGSPASRAGMASLAASQADAETKAASKMADYSLDAAAQDVEQFSYLYDLAAAEERKMGQELSQVQADIARIKDDNPKDLVTQKRELLVLRAGHLEVGDESAVAMIDRALVLLG